MTDQPPFCPKHGRHEGMECPQCAELERARGILRTTYIPPAPRTSSTQPGCGVEGCQIVATHYHCGQERPPGDYVDLPPSVVKALEQKNAEIERLEKLVYVLGHWKCAKCGFYLVSTNMHVPSGAFSANNEPQQCANGCGPMWRVTERDAGNQAAQNHIDFREKVWAALGIEPTNEEKSLELMRSRPAMPFGNGHRATLDKAIEWAKQYGDAGDLSDLTELRAWLGPWRNTAAKAGGEGA